MFFEVLLDAATFTAAGFEGRDELEDPLDDLLAEQGLGSVTGGGGGQGRMNIDVELTASMPLEDCVAALRTMLRSLRAPSDTIIKSGPPDTRTWTLQET